MSKGAPSGGYVVQIGFIVKEDGTVTDIKPITNFGYGMEEETIRVIKNRANGYLQNILVFR